MKNVQPELGVCNIHLVCDNILVVVLTMCNLTISSILQKPKTYASGLLSWGHFVSSKILDLIAQILFELSWTMPLLNSIMKCLQLV